MPTPRYSINVPFPGYVDICLWDTGPMRFSKEAIRRAIEGLKARRETFETDAAYRAILEIYEQALSLLEKELK